MATPSPYAVAAREHFAAMARTLAREALAGTSGLANHVDIAEYVRQQEQNALDTLAGQWDGTFTQRQWAHHARTGEWIAFLPTYEDSRTRGDKPKEMQHD